jgi:thymidylate synthase ThyX
VVLEPSSDGSFLFGEIMIGKGNISAKVIADSISPDGVRLTTFELEYPRFIHAEFMTHRLFSRNAASSRAIPVSKMIDLVESNTAKPIHWGKNQPGMSAKEELSAEEGTMIWLQAMKSAVEYANRYAFAGYHKQLVNRILEPFTMIKVVCTATEFDNFFWLRNHPDAQPEIAELARLMWEEYSTSKPNLLHPNEWHVPYVKFDVISRGYFLDLDDKQEWLTLEDALAVSSSCCAQVSYRKLDDSLEKAREIFKRLVESKPVHASPFEHQATPLTYGMAGDTQVKGTTGFDNKGNAWSGNFRQWIQHRQLIEDHTCWQYKK